MNKSDRSLIIQITIVLIESFLLLHISNSSIINIKYGTEYGSFHLILCYIGFILSVIIAIAIPPFTMLNLSDGSEREEFETKQKKRITIKMEVVDDGR